MNPNEFAAYLAGVIDSDGSISVAIRHRDRPNPSYCILISITWANTGKVLYALNKIKKIYGGAVYFAKRRSGFPNGKDTYRYCIGNKKSKRMLEDILPYLILKKEQGTLALKLINTTKIGKYGFGRPKPLSLKQKHYNIYLKMKQLNSKNSGERRQNETLR